jgi:hypothetical protein
MKSLMVFKVEALYCFVKPRSFFKKKYMLYKCEMKIKFEHVKLFFKEDIINLFQ